MRVSAKRRIVALWFPRLSTDRLQRRWKAKRGAPSPDAPPLVIAAKENNALVISALDRKATALGLRVGQPLANARAMLPMLKAVTANEPADLKLLGRIADWCERFTPYVALDPPRGLLLDVTGVSHLFGGERAMLDLIRERLRDQGFAVRGALASTLMAARALARYGDGAVVPPGGESEAVAPLPIEALYLDPVTTHAFRRAGLKTIGAAASRKRSELTARFGARMVFKLDGALARAETPISPRRSPADYCAERSFAEPIATGDIILSTLKALAAALGRSLEKQGEGARHLEASFFRADGQVRRIAVETGSPIRDPKIVERLFREKLDALIDPIDPGFGFDLIRLSATRAERAECEAADFDADMNAKKEIRFLIDRLAARFGTQRILAFEPVDTHIPECAFAAVPAQYARESKAEWKTLRRPGEAPRRPLRLFAKPEQASLLRSVPESSAFHMRWRRMQRIVTHVEGPERIAMEWWRHQEAQPTRDYFRAETEDGRRFWLYRDGVFDRDGLAPQWRVHGAFA
ncbi:MAG TPA: DNA polymerase Y family protein [Rhizomicrobium sp.]|jgi:protein ImuB|nr:DNA polymerase Y family protein [Rhizomicrobium sp.]